MWLANTFSFDGKSKDKQQKSDDNKKKQQELAENMTEPENTQAVDSTMTSEAPTSTNSSADILPNVPYHKENIVAEWHVPLKGQIYRVEFEHGTTTGKRVIWVNQIAVLHREWMFKLVGDDVFNLEDVRCVLRVNPSPGFRYSYTLYVDGKPLKQFKETQARALRTWEVTVEDRHYRVVLEKETLNIYLNGELREEEAEFVDVGTETRWMTDNDSFVLTTRNSGNKREGIIHDLVVNGNSIDELSIND